MSFETMQAAAEAALDKGFSVFPLKPRSKEPATQHGHKDASAMPAEIEARWTRNPEANVGVACGESNLTVLDFDNGEEPEYTKKIKTYRVKTARGFHVYLWGARPTAKMYDDSGKHVGEAKSLGGYVLGEGSIHPSGAVYTILDDSPIIDAPPGLIEKLTRKSASESSPATVVGDVIPYGQHDNELHRIAGRLRHDGLEEEAIFNALVEVCEKRCENYGSDYLEMCRKHAHNICEKQVGTGLTVTIDGRDPETGIQVSMPVQAAPAIEPAQWRSQFKVVNELEDGGVKMLIDGFLPEGTIFLGALSGQGKTLVALSLVHALTTGEPMFGHFEVPVKRPVLYLIPESSGRAFKSRLRKFNIPNDERLFLCRTLSEGRTIRLDDPVLHEAVRQMKPVVILDTAIRFSTADDENSSVQNQKLVDDMIALRQLGSPAVVAIHHATKSSRLESMDLENSLRGTGDLGACADAVYGIRRDESLYDNGNGPLELEVACVKPRDFDPPRPFRIVASHRNAEGAIVSNIDTKGDFEMVDPDAVQFSQASRIASLVQNNLKISLRAIGEELGYSKDRVARHIDKLGYVKRNGTWILKSTYEPQSGATAKAA